MKRHGHIFVADVIAYAFVGEFLQVQNLWEGEYFNESCKMIY